MRVTVFGASGGTGKQVINKLLSRGFDVLAFVYNTEIEKPGLETLQGDARVFEDVENAVENSDAIISCLGVERGQEPVCAEGVRNIVKAMHQEDISRIIVQSAYGAGKPRKGLYTKWLRFGIPNLIKDKEEMEKLLEESNLDYTVVRPVWLTNGKETGEYKAGTDKTFRGLRPTISRKDTADFMIKMLEEDRFIRETVNLGP